MNKIKSLLVFAEVVAAQSLTAAAKRLNLSTAAVSQQLSQLEAEYGVNLLRRTTRRIQLTEVGELLYEQCKKLQDDLAQTELLMQRLQATPSGNLRVVANRYFGEALLLPNLAEFLNLYPGIRLDLELAERIPDLLSERIDVLFGVSVRGSESWVQKKLASTRYVLCASPAYFKKNGLPRTPQDLSNARYITHSMRKPSDSILFKNEQRIHVKPFLSLNDAHAMLQCALAGLGIVYLHDYLVRPALADGRLVEALPDLSLTTPVYLYYQAAKFQDPRIRKFVEFFADKEA